MPMITLEDGQRIHVITPVIEKAFNEVKHNRRIKTAPKLSGRWWCTGCDGYMVYVGQVCPRCGWKHSKETSHLRH